MPYTQAVLNGAAFNPTAGCRDATQCSGKGGLLAFMEVPSTKCTTTASAWDIKNGLSGGEIAGIVIGSVCGVMLIGVLAWVGWNRT